MRYATLAAGLIAGALLVGATAASAQSCVADGPDASRCRFLLPEMRDVQVLARAYLRRTGGHPAADLHLSVDGRMCFHRLEHPGVVNGAAVGSCRLKLDAGEHEIEAAAAVTDAAPFGVGVETTTREPPLNPFGPHKRRR